MKPGTLVPVEDYLHTSYDPDCDYVEGVLEERNVGERDHGIVQGHVYAWFLSRRAELGVYPFIEQRLHVAPGRFRVPDVCLVEGGKPSEQVFSEPPLVVVEILSAEDRMSRMQEKIADYLAFGVAHVWVIDPRTRTAWSHTADRSHECRDGVLKAGDRIRLPLAGILAELDS